MFERHFTPQRVTNRFSGRAGRTDSQLIPGRLDPQVSWVYVIWEDSPLGIAEKTLSDDLVFGGGVDAVAA